MDIDFEKLKSLQQSHLALLFEHASAMFVTEAHRDELWSLYLSIFPPGTNEVFRERTFYDCSCCRQFIKQFGNVVFIVGDYELASIWDFETDSDKFQPVLDALSSAVKAGPIRDVFVTRESSFGTDKTREQWKDGTVHTWHHFRVALPSRLVLDSHKTAATVMAERRDSKSVFKRSLDEISQDAVETILDLIAEKSLYKGLEWRGALEKFLALHKEYHGLDEARRDNFCWLKSVEVGGAVSRIRNHSIGTLLTDITDDIDLGEAVRRYEAIVAPTSYKRPKAIYSKKMVEAAQKEVERLGFLDSLARRHATIGDITINNVVWANRNVAPYMNGAGGVFDLLKQEAVEGPKKFDGVPSVGIEDFIANILPGASSVEVLLENKYEPNLVTLIAPQVPSSKTMFKWENPFSWAYNGNITDSMKERVRSMGGKVDGVLRASLQWENNNDFDLHCVEPNGNRIHFPSAGRRHSSSGMLDVDIVNPSNDTRVVDGVAVENIIYTVEHKMQEGEYSILVHNYSHRGGTSGFQVELEHNGQIYSYDYPHELRPDEYVLVARFNFYRQAGIKFIGGLPSAAASKTIWGLPTNQFHPVTSFMFSPNHWEGQVGVGHKHYFFMLLDCKTDDRPNGFFNEFLKEGLMRHRRVFEALGSKMKVPESDDQLSGLGFSSTKRNALVCRIDNKKIIKVVF